MFLQLILDATNKLREEIRFLLLYTCAGCIVYYLLISHGLFNHYDGLWHPSRFYAGDWEVSLGRWVWPYIDRFRFGLVSAPMNALFSLIMTGLGHCLLFRLFDVKSVFVRLLTGLLWIGSTAFSVSLSYVYMSPTFAAAFLFSIAAVYVLIRVNTAAGFVSSAFLFALSMGCYQAYSGVSCLILCAYFIVLFSRTEPVTDILKYCVKTACMILGGGILYLLGTKLHLHLRNIALEEYGGASSVTAGAIVRNLPSGIKLCYTEFYKYFATSSRHSNYFKENQATLLVFSVLIVIMAVRLFGVARKSLLHAVLMSAGAVLLPLAANFVLLLAVDSTYIKIQMSCGMAMMPSVLLCMTHLTVCGIVQRIPGKKTLIPRTAAALVTISTALLVWFRICSVTNDQLAMEEGRTSVSAIAQMVTDDLMDEDVIVSGEKICIIGIPSENTLFFRNEAWKQANQFARFGRWSVTAECDFFSWRSTFKYLRGLNLNFCSPGEYGKLKKSEKVEEMPCYPAQGSIQKIGDIVVVKISDQY